MIPLELDDLKIWLRQHRREARTASAALLGLAVLLAFTMRGGDASNTEQVSISELIGLANTGGVGEIVIQGSMLSAYQESTGQTFEADVGSNLSILDTVELLQAGGVDLVPPGGIGITYKKPNQAALRAIGYLALQVVPSVALLLFIYHMYRRQMGFDKVIKPSDLPRVTFRDIAGAQTAKEELQEVVAFLRDSAPYTQVGAQIPKGVLLTGPPGTGKTLMARAVAGEADVPFLYVGGSEFVEMYVGLGAHRVRQVFKAAKKRAPCVVFIDELDALGARRGSDQSHGEKDQTLNQILTEMDGFKKNENVVVMAATNRPEVLDEALMRSGRIDRKVVLDAPLAKDRSAILQLHAEGKPMSPVINWDVLAPTTEGMSGADLANVMNESAILTARWGRDIIELDAVTEAIERVQGGAARREETFTEQEREMIAYHEAGHAVVAWAIQGVQYVSAISMVPRSASGGHTSLACNQDRRLHTEDECNDTLTIALGGRAAEEVVFGVVSSGAASDLHAAANIAREMVQLFNMDGRGDATNLGLQTLTPEGLAEPVNQVLRQSYRRAMTVLEEHLDDLECIAEHLLVKTRLTGEEMNALLGAATRT